MCRALSGEDRGLPQAVREIKKFYVMFVLYERNLAKYRHIMYILCISLE